MMKGFSNIIKQKMQEKAYRPSPGAWQAMEAKINAEPALQPKARSRYWIPAAAAALILAAIFIFWPSEPAINTHNPETEQPIASPSPTTPALPNQLEPSRQNTTDEGYMQKPLSSAPQRRIPASKPNRKPQQTTAAPTVAAAPPVNTENIVSAKESHLPKGEGKATEKPSPILQNNTKSLAESTLHPASESRLWQGAIDLPPMPLSLRQLTNVQPATANALLTVPRPLTTSMLQNSKWQLGEVFLLVDNYRAPDGSERSIGLGAELNWQRNNWQLSAGLISQSLTHNQNVNHKKEWYDLHHEDLHIVNARMHRRVDSSWVITGVNKGTYVYDTSYHMTYDTTRKTLSDTSWHSQWQQQEQITRLSYTEIPLHLRYRWQWQRWELQTGVGLNLGILTNQRQSENQNSHIENHLLSDASLQMGLRYHLTPRLSLLVRPHFRFTLGGTGALRSAPARWGMQTGAIVRL